MGPGGDASIQRADGPAFRLQGSTDFCIVQGSGEIEVREVKETEKRLRQIEECERIIDEELAKLNLPGV